MLPGRVSTMIETEPWVCPTCHIRVSTYRPECGERPLSERELTLRGIFNQVVQAFIKIDGRLIRSFRYLVCRPGFLTVAYLKGQRKPYVGPISLFMIANGLFFATESLTRGPSLRRRSTHIFTGNRGVASQCCWYRIVYRRCRRRLMSMHQFSITPWRRSISSRERAGSIPRTSW